MTDFSALSNDQYKLIINSDDDFVVAGKPRLIDRICLPARYIFVLCSFFGFIIIYLLRVNISMAIISMVNHSAIDPKATFTPECHVIKINETKPVDGKYVWDEKIQGIILGAFFWGYLPLQIPAGWLAGNVGGKWLFGVGVLCTSVLTLLTPIASEIHYGCLIALRVLEGFFESITFPAMHTMLGRWSPHSEITFMSGITYSGILIGIIFALVVSGFLIDNNVMGGWPSVFYIPGIIGIVWFIVWSFLAYSSPKDHPRISEKEKRYIEESINLPNEEKNQKVPWKEILLSKPVWAISISNFCSMWFNYICITSIPEYFKNVIGFSITEVGFVSFLPYILSSIVFVSSSKAADFIRSRNILSTTATRKLFNSVGIAVWAIIIMFISYAGCNQVLVVSLFCISSAFSSLTAAGYNVNNLDLSPQYAGILSGLTNTFATLAGIIGPYVVGVLTEHNESKEQWKIIFLISGGLNLFGGIFYLVFGSGERQPWAMDKSQ